MESNVSLMDREPLDVDSAPQVAPFDADRPQPPLKVMHVLSVSIPYINGYALRSKYIVETQADSGVVEPCVVTSPFYPGVEGTAENAVIRGIPYHRVANPQDRDFLRDPRLLPFVMLHWTKRLAEWAIPLFVRTRRKALRSVKKRLRNQRRSLWAYLRRCKRNLRRVARCSKRLVCSVVHLIEVILEPVIGKRFASAVKVFSRWCVALMWLISRPFQAAAEVIAKAARSGFRFVSRIGRHLRFRSAPRDERRRPPLRQRLITALRLREKQLLIRLFERELLELCQTHQPDVIHVHSPYFCGVPAIKAGRKAGIPVVYEVRGIWEESGVAQGNFDRDSEDYLFWRRQETWAMQNADAVTCICEELRKEIISRNVAAERVFVAANAVDTELFVPRRKSPAAAQESSESISEIRERLGTTVIGYIGSIRPLEGVDGLVRGAAEVINRGYDASLLVVGGGKDVEDLERLAEDLGIGDQAIFTGQVPHDEVQDYYELIDIFVISRPASRVAQLVTPLKPLEAMAMEKTLVVSDLPALQEIVADNRTGLVYRAENDTDLADKCIRLINDPVLRDTLARSARQWVCEERSWEQTIQPQLEAYASVVDRFATEPKPAHVSQAKAA